MTINEEIINLNIDILAKTGLKKATINKLHKLKVKRIGDLSQIELSQLEQLLAADGAVALEDLTELLAMDIEDFTRVILDCIKDDPIYEAIMLHLDNHTYQEIAKKLDLPKEKIKENINKFLQNLFTLVDNLANKLMVNTTVLTLEALEELELEEASHMVLLLAYREHATKWKFSSEMEGFIKL